MIYSMAGGDAEFGDETWQYPGEMLAVARSGASQVAMRATNPWFGQ